MVLRWDPKPKRAGAAGKESWGWGGALGPSLSGRSKHESPLKTQAQMQETAILWNYFLSQRESPSHAGIVHDQGFPGGLLQKPGG